MTSCLSAEGVSLIDECLTPEGSVVLFSDAQWLDALLRYEAALARAQADCGLIPGTAATAIAQACASVRLDRSAFIARAQRTGALGIGLVEPLRAFLAEHAADALPYLHWGTTTQDAVDTAHALVTQAALEALLAELTALNDALRALAHAHARTPILARSLLQPAQVSSFGLKCAQSAKAIERSMTQLRRLSGQALCVQLGGAVGNRATLGEQGVRVEQALASELGLTAAGYSWHTQRDSWMRLAMEAAVCAGSLSKLARDWSLMMQFEIGELAETPCGRTSSAMPHKRNAVYCMQAIAQTQPMPGLAASLLSTMPQAHERAMGEWQAELAMWAPLWRHTYAAAAALRHSTQGLQVDTEQMQAHIDALYEVVFSESCSDALAAITGREAAQQAIERLAPQALATRQPLSALLLEWVRTHYSATQTQQAEQALQIATDPARAVRASALCCEQLLAHSRI